MLALSFVYIVKMNRKVLEVNIVADALIMEITLNEINININDYVLKIS